LMKSFAASPSSLARTGCMGCREAPRRFSRRMTRPPTYRGDKLSRLPPPSELIECHSSCGIRNLAEGGRLAPILPSRLVPRADKLDQDFAAGRLSDRDLLIVILGLAALVLIIVAAR
jgi:hypothetical protein